MSRWFDGVRTWTIALGLLAFGACVNVKSERGVEARWHDLQPGALVDGETTRSQVLELLGPPSQILSLAEGTAFYYLLEKTDGDGLILIAYNTRTEHTVYDRAVFFFDDQGLLSDHAMSAGRD